LTVTPIYGYDGIEEQSPLNYPVPITYSSPHPYVNKYTYGQEVHVPNGAVSMLVHFGLDTSTEQNYDFVVLCKDVSCVSNWGSFSGINFPGIYPNAPLSIPATSMYISFASDGKNTDFGFEIIITPIYGTI